jgi:hypothetical protein
VRTADVEGVQELLQDHIAQLLQHGVLEPVLGVGAEHHFGQLKREVCRLPQAHACRE